MKETGKSKMEIEGHIFGPGVVPELSTKLYKNPLAAIREAVSNSFDAMSPYEDNEDPRIEIYTNGEEVQA